MTLNQMMNE